MSLGESDTKIVLTQAKKKQNKKTYFSTMFTCNDLH